MKNKSNQPFKSFSKYPKSSLIHDNQWNLSPSLKSSWDYESYRRYSPHLRHFYHPLAGDSMMKMPGFSPLAGNPISPLAGNAIVNPNLKSNVPRGYRASLAGNPTSSPFVNQDPQYRELLKIIPVTQRDSLKKISTQTKKQTPAPTKDIKQMEQVAERMEQAAQRMEQAVDRLTQALENLTQSVESTKENLS